jgi:DNA-binding transcriptional MerR regulator
VSDERTYSAPEVAEELGVSYRQLDYWIHRLGWKHHQSGSGTQRELTKDEVQVLRRVRDLRQRMADTQVELEHMFSVSKQEATTPRVPV